MEYITRIDSSTHASFIQGSKSHHKTVVFCQGREEGSATHRHTGRQAKVASLRIMNVVHEWGNRHINSRSTQCSQFHTFI